MSFLNHFFAEIDTIGLAISLLLSIAGCFFGYKLMKFWIAVAGFILGFVLGDVVCAFFKLQSAGIFFLIGAVVGIVLAIVSFKLYKAGVFLLGAVLGGGISALVLGTQEWWHILVAVLIGSAVGALAVVAVKPVVIFSSAISGGLSALQLSGALFGFAAVYPTVVTVAGVVLAILGVAVQFATNKKEPEKSAQS